MPASLFFPPGSWKRERAGGPNEEGPRRVAPRAQPPTMARRAVVLLASVLGVAVTLTLASLVVDATDARAREPRDPAEKPGRRRAGPEAPRTPRGWCQRGVRRLRRGRGGRRRSRAKARRVRLRLRAGGVRRAAGLVCSVPDGRSVQNEATGAVGGTAGQELRVPCSEPLHVGDVPAGPANAALGRRRRERREGVRRVRDVRHTAGTGGSGPRRFEVRRRGPGPRLEVRPEAALLAYSAFMFVDFTMAAAAAGKPLPQDLPTTSQYPISPATVGARVAPGDPRARHGGDWQTHDATTTRTPPTITSRPPPPTSTRRRRRRRRLRPNLRPNLHRLRLCATWTISWTSSRPRSLLSSRACPARPRRVAKTWQTSWGSRRTRT